jgi:hypothetical protein
MVRLHRQNTCQPVPLTTTRQQTPYGAVAPLILNQAHHFASDLVTHKANQHRYLPSRNNLPPHHLERRSRPSHSQLTQPRPGPSHSSAAPCESGPLMADFSMRLRPAARGTTPTDRSRVAGPRRSRCQGPLPVTKVDQWEPSAATDVDGCALSSPKVRYRNSQVRVAITAASCRATPMTDLPQHPHR